MGDGSGLRVGAIIANESVSGPGRQLAALATALAARGAEFRVLILHREGNPPPAFGEYLDRAGVGHETATDRGPLDFALVRRVRRWLEALRPSLVQTHGYKATAVAWALRATGAPWPWVGFFHGETHEDLKARFYHWLDRRMLGAADRAVVMSGLQRAELSRMGDRVRIIHNAVLPEPRAGGDDDQERIDGVAAGLARPRLGVVGRLSPEKGVDVFLEALAHLAGRDHPFSALIAGEGPEMAALTARADALGIADRVSFLGTVRNVASLYRQLDVVVIPSRSEGLPNVLLEAIGADLPVVATRVGAIPEVLTDPATGVIVPPEDAAALADAIPAALELARDPVARAARLTTAAAFSVDRRVDSHLDLYHEVLRTRIPAP